MVDAFERPVAAGAVDLFQVFPGDSEMARRMRDFDWSSTSLGPPGAWPQNLRIALGICLFAPFPFQIWWGRGLTLFYNDACIPLFAEGRHPSVLGGTARDAWAATWDSIGPTVTAVLLTRAATQSKDVPVAFAGPGPDTVNARLSISPVFGPEGGIDGLLCACPEAVIRALELKRLNCALREEAGHDDRDEHALRAIEERFRALVEPWVHTVWEADALGSGADTPAWRARTGHSLEEWLADGWAQAVHPDDREIALRQWQQAIRSAAPVDAEFRLRGPDGDWRWTNFRAAPLRNPDGSVSKWVGMNVDVTARKLAEEVERAAATRDAFRATLADTFRSLRDGAEIQAAATRLVGDYLRASRVLYAEVDRENAVVRAEHCRDGMASVLGVHPIADLAPLEALRCGTVLTAYPASIEPAVGSTAGGVGQKACTAGICAQVSVPLIQAGRLVAFMTCQQSETRGWTEEEVALIQQVTALTWAAVEKARADEALREANESLQEADRRKNAFLALLSHELRNPLTPIRNSLYVLKRAEPGGAQANRALEVIDRQFGQLVRLVEDLLDVTRVTRGKVQLQRRRVEVNDLVHQAIDDHRSLFAHARLTIHLEPAARPLYVNADPTRIAQVVGNLLQNAAKFTPPGGRVSVSLSAEAGQAVLRVADNGVGIAPEMLLRLFQPFTQAEESLHRASGGLGLGLALVKGFVELHGGDVSATSAGLGHGSEFEVRLPLDLNAVERPMRVARPPAVRRRVLVVEDNIDAANTLCELLQLHEHEVAVAYDGCEAIAKARHFLPEVMLCDIGLPGMDGYAVARTIAADEALRGVHLVALSGYALPEDVSRARDAGFARHLRKPARPEELEDLLASFPAERDAKRTLPSSH